MAILGFIIISMLAPLRKGIWVFYQKEAVYGATKAGLSCAF